MHSRLLNFFALWSEFSIKCKRDRMIVQRFVNRMNGGTVNRCFTAWEKFTDTQLLKKSLEEEKKEFEENVNLHHEASMNVAEKKHKQQLEKTIKTHEERLAEERQRLEEESKRKEADMEQQIHDMKNQHAASKMAHKVASEAAVRARLKLMEERNQGEWAKRAIKQSRASASISKNNAIGYLCSKS